MLKLQFLTGKKHNEEWSTVKNCNFSKLQFFKCTSTVISLHIFAVLMMRLVELQEVKYGTFMYLNERSSFDTLHYTHAFSDKLVGKC